MAQTLDSLERNTALYLVTVGRLKLLLSSADKHATGRICIGYYTIPVAVRY